MTLYVLHSILTDASMTYIDDDQDVLVPDFLGVFSSIEKAKAHASVTAETERDDANDLLDEGEAEFPATVLNWREEDGDLVSDTFEYVFGATNFVISEVTVDEGL